MIGHHPIFSASILVTERRYALPLAGREMSPMDAAYFEGRLAVSIALMNAATDPGARRAHSGMVDGYHALVSGRPRRITRWPEGALASRYYNIGDALARWADDGGHWREVG